MQAVAEKVIARAKELLASGEVQRVLGWEKGEFDYERTPALFDQNNIDKLVYDKFCAANLSKKLVEVSKLEGKTLALIKPCDSLSLNQLLCEHRVKRENIYVLGVGCKGMEGKDGLCMKCEFCKGKTFPGAWHLYANLAPAEESFIGQARVFEESQSEQLLKPEYRKAPSVQSIVDKTYARVEGKGLSELKKKQYLDMHQWMPGDILLKADKMTMAHSLELRVPLLDKELMGVAEQVPTKYLITDENTKYAFRQAAGRHLPKEWYDREKLGFPVPIKKWLREEKFYKYVRSVFERDYVSQFFDQDALLKMIDDNYAGKTDDRRKIWTVYSFLTWYDVYFVHDGEKPDVIAIA